MTRIGMLTWFPDAAVTTDPAGTNLKRSQLPFLNTVAGALGVAVHNARLLSRARREVTRSRALRAVTQELTGQLDLAAVLDDIVDRTRALFEADKASAEIIVHLSKNRSGGICDSVLEHPLDVLVRFVQALLNQVKRTRPTERDDVVQVDRHAGSRCA